MNADGNLDLVSSTTTGSNSSVSLLLGNGDGTFQSPMNFTTGFLEFVAPAIGDFNGDGRLDVVTANSSTPATFSVLLQTTGPVASVSPTSLTFPVQVIHTTSAAQTVTLSNTGASTLSITSIATSGDFSQSNTCGNSVAPGASCAITVSFTPTRAGTRTGTLTINDNAPGSPQTVSLSGTGTAFAISPASLDFGTVKVGMTSQPQTITISNVSAQPVSITSISIKGKNPFDFAETNNCGNGLPGNSSCTISVTFTPIQSGGRSALVAMVDQAGGSPQRVTLSGRGE
jgi:hypothetical protein